MDSGQTATALRSLIWAGLIHGPTRKGDAYWQLPTSLLSRCAHFMGRELVGGRGKRGKEGGAGGAVPDLPRSPHRPGTLEGIP